MQGDLKERSVLVVRPLIALVLLLGGADGLTDSPAVVVPLGLALLVLLAYLVLPLPIPRAVQPGWYRTRTRPRNGDPGPQGRVT